MLAMQFNDTFQSMALGMSPIQILLQQGPLIGDLPSVHALMLRVAWPIWAWAFAA